MPLLSLELARTELSGPMAEAIEMWMSIENHVPVVLHPEYFYSSFGAPYPDGLTRHSSVERFCEVYWEHHHLLPWQHKEMRMTAEFLFCYLAGFDVDGVDAALAHFVNLALLASDRSRSNAGDILSIRHHMKTGFFGRFFTPCAAGGVYLPEPRKVKEAVLELNKAVAARPAGEWIHEMMQLAASIERDTAPPLPTSAQS